MNDADIDPTLTERTNEKLFKTKLYIAFSKDTADSEVNKWQQALGQLKTSGKHGETLKKYTLH